MKMPAAFSNKLVMGLFTVAAMAISQSAFAHTRLQTPHIQENAANHGSNYNAVVIGHGCRNPSTGNSDIDTVGNVTVFPDGVDSTITVDGQPYEGPLTDFVQNWGSPVSKVQNKDVFAMEDHIKDQLGNKLGFWAAGLPHRQGDLIGLLPFRTAGVIIEPTSCAKSVTFTVAIADVCQVTPISGFTDEVVMLWTPAVGSNFDGPDLNGYDSPATLTVERAETNALPESCGEGSEVVVTPSAAQLNRDMPVMINGEQVWPQP